MIINLLNIEKAITQVSGRSNLCQKKTNYSFFDGKSNLSGSRIFVFFMQQFLFDNIFNHKTLTFFQGSGSLLCFHNSLTHINCYCYDYCCSYRYCCCYSIFSGFWIFVLFPHQSDPHHILLCRQPIGFTFGSSFVSKSSSLSSQRDVVVLQVKTFLKYSLLMC